MPSNKYRKLLFERTSADGSAIFRFYETGCLVGLDAKNPGPRKSGEGGYLRFNNLQNVSPLTVFRLIKRMGDLGVILRPLMVDYAHFHHHELLKDWLKDRKTDKWTAFAAFRSAVKEARGEITYAEALELVKPQLGLIERAKDLNRLEYMFRPELGLISGDLSKRTNKEGFQVILKTIEDRRGSKLFAHHFKRFDEEVELSIFSQARKNEFSPGITVGLSSLASGLLTADELKKFKDICQKATGGDYAIPLDNKLSFLISYALVQYGASRAVDILMYARDRHEEWLQTLKDGYYSTWQVNFERLNDFNGGKITDEAIYAAVDEVDYPFEWALMVSSV